MNELVKFPKKVDVKLLHKVHDFLYLLENLNPSKQTHYHQLDEWRNPITDFLHKVLNETGFVNGQGCSNEECSFWWSVYTSPDLIVFSNYLKTQVNNHHASAFERNEALIQFFEDIYERLNQIYEHDS